MSGAMRVEIQPEIPGATAPEKQSAESKPAERPAYVPEKFWKDGKVDLEGVMKSYSELERRYSSKPTQPQPDPSKGEEGKKAEDGKGTESNPAESKPAEGDAYIPGVSKADTASFTKELTESGQLSEASYEKLAKAGYPKAAVDLYINGIRAEQQAQNATATEIKGLAGGEEGYQAMMEWGANNLTDAEVAEYNEAMNSGKKSIIKLAVEKMHARYTEAVGQTPKLLGGKGNNPAQGDVFHSRAEVTAAMRDSRYRTDEAYRQSVQAKLGRSKVI